MKKNVRLPRNVTPVRYSITLRPDLEAFTFAGREEILIEVKEPTSKIILHSKELKIEAVNIKPVNRRARADKAGSIFAKKTSYDERAETAAFTFPEILPKGQYTLKLGFKGVLNDYMRGFYKSAYTHGGVKKHLAVSQFEATDARRAFPGFDEPAQKAVFEISLVIPRHLSAISNTLPAEIREHGDGHKIVRFKPTPKMSTYLAAFLVGEFEYLEGKTKRGVIVRVHTSPGKKRQGRFALGCAIKVLEFYDEYFGIPYPLKTLDMIAIPDFAHGAMENWGAVTYRESALLIDNGNSSSANKQWVALVIAHELAHQWFGNLVTMEWWTHLWLNEGFASYIEYLAVDRLFPEWDIWTQFAYNDLGVALRLDGLASTHPVETEVRHPDEIGEIFDEVSYSKGSSVIRMLAAYLGEKDFRAGLHYYLNKHSYSNASTIHLWQAFEKVSGKPVSKIMRNWTGKPGYPLVEVKQTAGDRRQTKIKLTQQRFFSSPAAWKKNHDKTLWQLPLSAITDKLSGPARKLLATKSKTYTVGKPRWIKFNAGETAFYRTKYPKDFLKKLSQPVRAGQLAAIDRLGIVRDLFALAQAGKIPAVDALEFVQNYRGESDYTVWVELSGGLIYLDSLLYGQSIYSNYRRFCQQLFGRLAAKLGWQAPAKQAHTQILLRGLALANAGYFGGARVIKRAKNKFKQSRIHPDIRGPVYNLAAQYGSAAEQNKMMDLYRRETLHEERNRLGRALGKFSDKKLMARSLDFFLSKQVRAQDTPLFIASAYANNYARAQTWRFVKQHWPEFLKRYGHGGHLLGRLIKPLELMRGRKNLLDVKLFFRQNAHPGADRAILQVLEQIQSNISLLDRDGGNLRDFLKKF